MNLLHHKPAAPLSAFVETIWHYECAPAQHPYERILPTGDMSIVINLRDEGFSVEGETFPGAILCGTFSGYFTLDTAQQAYTLGIHFKPGGAFPFLNMPAGELEDRHVALEDVWGARAADLRESLLAAKTPSHRFRIVEGALLAQLQPREPHAAVSHALHHMNGSVGEFASQIGLSPRRFADVFRAQVGLTPKLFCRIRRFQAALKRIAAGSEVEWADLALDCGYYDQSHFIHDFQAFSGLNPSAYTPSKPEYINHVPLRD